MDSAKNQILPYAPSPVQPSYARRRLRLRLSGYVALLGFAAYVGGMVLGVPAVRLAGIALFAGGAAWYAADFMVGVVKENLKW